MPMTPEEHKRLVDSLRLSLEKLASIDMAEIARPELGQLGFEPLRSSVEAIRQVCQLLLATPYNEMPYLVIQRVQNTLGYVDGPLMEIRAFKLDQYSASRSENPMQVIQQLQNRFEQSADKFWAEIMGVIGYAIGLKEQRTPQQSQVIAQSVLSEAHAAVAEAKKSREELENIVKASRDAAAEIGVSRHATLFQKEATTQAASAFKWLVATAAMAGATLLAFAGNLVYVARHSSDKVEPYAAIQIALAKVLAASLLVSATLWCGRLYRAARHNEVINRHRQNALSTFQTFVEGAGGDEQTKNAILLHAAQSIFTPQPSGLVPNEAEPSATPSIVELVRTIGSSPAPRA